MSKDRMMKRVEIDGDFPMHDGFAAPLSEMRTWIDDIEKITPEEFRDSILFRLADKGCCGDLNIEFFYNRPETDDEFEVRMRQERARSEGRMAMDLAELARLKEKYPNHS